MTKQATVMMPKSDLFLYMSVFPLEYSSAHNVQSGRIGFALVGQKCDAAGDGNGRNRI